MGSGFSQDDDTRDAVELFLKAFDSGAFHFPETFTMVSKGAIFEGLNVQWCKID
jgi:hypothetical protein